MGEFLTLKKSNCKNCYKCIRHCPVKSIRFSGNQAYIVGNECILCGQCFVVCPQNAKQITSEVEKVKVLLQGTEPVIASIAPSFIANYDGVGIEGMRDALRALGFADAEETAIGATMVKNEYNRMLKEEGRDILISSCCHSINLLIQKHFPNSLKYLADTVSPMQAHCMDIKKRHPDAKTVFIGPCVAKKDEADYYGNIVDAVLTFEELTNWFKEENIELRKGIDDTNKSRARLFPTSGGIIATLGEKLPEYTYMAIDGVEKCMEALKDIEEGKLHKCFIEMNSCVGGCLGGPVMEKYHHSPVRDYVAVTEYAGKEDFEVTGLPPENMKKYIEPIGRKLRQPTDEEIRNILTQMGKKKKEDELNCGSCGYNTCRDKAAAIIQGKADLTMCLPYLKDRAESFSDQVVNITTNGIIVLNENLEVQQINKAALKLMNIARAYDVMGEPVIRILDPAIFIKVRDTGRAVYGEKVYLAEYDRYVEQTVAYDRDYKIIICNMRDVTEEQTQRARKEEISKQTVEIADKVVEKQMRIVQEIASLLGETAAETKIALSKLKEAIADE